MAGKNPTLLITGGLNKKATKDAIQAQLDKLGNELKLTIGVDKNASKDAKSVTEEKKKQLNVERLISEAKERTARAEQKQFDLARSKTSKLLKQEIQDRVTIEKQTLKQVNAEKAVTSQLDKQREKLALFQDEIARKSTKLTSGKYSNTVDTSALSSLQSRTNALSIGSASDIKSVQTEMAKINSEFKNIALNAQQARSGFVRFGEEAKHSFQKFSEYMIIGSIWMGAVSQIQKAVQSVYELDNAINQVRIVTGQSQEEARGLIDTFKKLGSETNVNLKDTANLYADLSRQGLEGTALEDRFKAISVYSKISGLDVQKSMDIITSAVNGTKRPVEEIIDTFAVLGDKSSADSAELGEALQRTASVASVAGIDFKKLSSYIATISETTRTAASVVGQSVRSMIVRFNQLREQGFNEEDTTKINDVVQALSTIGIDAFDDSTQSLMNFSDIIEQLAPKWDTLDEKTKNYIQTSLAGNYQADKFAALMSNYTRAQELYGYALDSSGQATKKFEIYQESAQAKVEKFQLALQSLYTSVLDSSFLKNSIDSMTEFVNILNLATKDATVLASVLTTLASAFTLLKASALVKEGGLLAGAGLSVGALGGIAIAVGALAVAIISVKTALDEARVATENFAKAQQDLNFIIAEGGDSAKTRQTDLEALVDKYDEATKKLSSARAVLAENNGKDFSGNLERSISAQMKVVSDLEKEFEKLGTTSFDAKNKIKLLQDAIWEQTKATKALTDLDTVNKTQSELSTASQLAKTYSELSEKKNKSAKETALLKEKSELLKATLNNLNIEYTVGSDGLISNVDGIQKLIVSQQNLTDVEKAEVIERMNNKKAELDATLKYIKTELEARQILAKASFYETQKFQEVLSDPLNIKGGGVSRTGTEQDKLSAMMDESLKGKQKQVEDTLGAYNSALDELAKKSAGTPNLLSNPNSTSSKSSASTKDPYLSTLNLQYQELERQISLTNQSLKDNQNAMSSNAETDKQKILYLEKEVELNKTLQSQYANLAKAKRAEMQSIQSKLNAFGLGVSTDKEDNITIKNWKNINSLSENNRKIADDLISKMQSLSGEVKGYGDSWTDANNKIISDNKEIANILKNDILTSLEKQRKLVTDDLLDGIKDEIEALEKARDAYKDKTDAQIERLENAKQIALDNKDLELESAQNALDNYNKSIEAQEQLNKLKEIDNKIVEENINYQKELAKLLDEKNSILSNKNVRQLNAQGTAFEYVADPLALKENADKITDLTDEHLKTLADLRVSRDEEVKSQAIKAEQDRLQAVIDRINKEKTNIENEFKFKINKLKQEEQAEIDSYNNKIEALKTFQTGLKEELDKGNTITKATQDQLYADLKKSDEQYFKDTITGYQNMVNEINKIMVDIGKYSSFNHSITLPSSSGSPTTSSSSSSSKTTSSAISNVGASISSSLSAGQVKKYHDGIESGLVGGFPIPKNYEQLALLAKKEGVFTENHMNNLSSNINSLMAKATNTVKSAGDIIIQSMTITTNNPKDFAYKMRDLRIGNS